MRMKSVAMVVEARTESAELELRAGFEQADIT